MGLYGSLKRIYYIARPPVVPKDESVIRFGILGAANIAPIALIMPAQTHPEVVIYAVAARDQSKAERFAQKHRIEKVYFGTSGYQDLLNDPNVDAVYNPLPNGLHYEWTMKALAAGKHVLLEKPSANTAAETRHMFQFAKARGLVLLEAFHYRFHPAVVRLKDIIDSGELGAIKSISAELSAPAGAMGDGDIRFAYDLGGGAAMDMGCYVMNVARYISGSEPVEVTAATPTLFHKDDRVDRAMQCVIQFPSNVTADVTCDLSRPGWGPGKKIPYLSKLLPNVAVKLEGGEVDMFNFILPSFVHSITVSPTGGGKRKETVYVGKDGFGEDYWLTYRYQLEAFVDKLKGREPRVWISEDESISNMRGVEMMYEKSNLGVRPASKFEMPAS